MANIYFRIWNPFSVYYFLLMVGMGSQLGKFTVITRSQGRGMWKCGELSGKMLPDRKDVAPEFCRMKCVETDEQ